ncbi:MAG: gamma-glutamyltransferase [Marinisporobacter sp.]|jgi:gamma-glutamyltranspeptidase/glutathione hydrolase|nr:gamma-glutamyltransferase [Marinisporobacter sp.]
MKKSKILKAVARVTALMLVLGMVTTGCTKPVEKEVTPSKQEAVEEIEKTHSASKRDAIGMNGMVAAATPEATQVGVDILKKGGNAIDAAVATGFALGVLEPNASGLGGGGFMMVRFAETGENVFIDFREMAPQKATADMYELDADGKPVNREYEVGAKSIAVPGEVAGLLTALEQYGTMKREEVMNPAIEYAERGFEASDVLCSIIEKKFDVISQFDSTSKLYLDDGLPLEAGHKIVNKDLANTLKVISKEGKDGFYKGEIAKKIVEEVQKHGGIITQDDLANYEVKMREPVVGTYRGYEIVSAPPASSGGTHVIELLNIMENYDMKDLGFNTANSWHAWAEGMKMMYADRGKYMADTDFVKVPLDGLVSKDYAKKQFERIDMNKSMEGVEAGEPWKYESGSTTHYSVVDKDGNMVAVTKTINHFFGSGVTVSGAGILLNDEMADFTIQPGNSNSIEPKKRPLSSMSPTFILKDQKPIATLGTPGGKRIITTVALIISNMIDYGMDIQEAIDAPRINHYESGQLKIEGRIPQEIRDELTNKGHDIDVKGDYDLYFGGAQGVTINEDTGELHGGADPRRDGQAIGY